MYRIICAWSIFCSIFILTNIRIFAYSKYELKCKKELLIISEEVAKREVGTIEIGKNRGEAEKYQIIAGIPLGSPYCAAGVYYCFEVGRKILNYSKDEIPILRTGLCLAMWNNAKERGNKVKALHRKHDLIIWKKSKTINGHIERIIECKSGYWVRTIGFNTGGNDEREGDGVHYKMRNLAHPLGRMKVIGLIGWKET